jgi:hypothetical protein
MAIAMGFGWSLSFLTPVLALSFFASPAPRPSLKNGVTFVAVIGAACLVGLVVGERLIVYPFVFVPFLGLVLFRLFFAKSGGAPPLLITWLLIAVLIIPLIVLQSPDLARWLTAGIFTGASMTILVVWLSYGLFPDPPGIFPEGAQGKTAAAPPPTEQRLRDAALSTAVVMPIVLLFYSLEFLNSILIMVFVAILSMQPGFAKNFKAGAALILGNVIGGAAAIVFYNLLVVVPEFFFLIVLTFLAGLLFGARVFSGKPTAPLYGMAFSTVVLVIGSVTSGDGEAGAKVYSRIIQIMIAVAYVVVAFGIVEKLFKPGERLSSNA